MYEIGAKNHVELVKVKSARNVQNLHNVQKMHFVILGKVRRGARAKNAPI